MTSGFGGVVDFFVVVGSGNETFLPPLGDYSLWGYISLESKIRMLYCGSDYGKNYLEGSE